MHSESGRHSDYTIFLIWNNTPSIELGFGRRFSIATQQRVTPLQREPGQHDSAERTLEADYTFFLIWNNTPSIELGLGGRFSIATQQRVTPLEREPGQHDSAERTLEADYTFFLYGTIR